MPHPLSEDYLYQQVADRLQQMIEEKVLRTGDKLPSVRMLSREQGISLSTAFQAYYQLESKGLIEARPKSGYYVRFNAARLTAVSPPPAAVPGDTVSVEAMIATIYRHLRSEEITQFSIAAPAQELLPAAKLDKALVQAVSSSRNHCLGYEDSQGHAGLRKQLARLAFTWGGTVQPDAVIVTAGCMEALVMCLRAVTQPGDTVAIESPTYFGIFRALQSLGLQAAEIRTDPATGVDLDHLKQAIDELPIKACLFVTNFGNPLGSLMPDEQKQALVQLLTAHRIPLIEDDIYGDLYFGKQRPKTCKAFDTQGWVLYCSSLSKSLAPGYRVGWTLPGRFTQAVLHHKTAYTVATNSPTQAAMAYFLEKGRYDFHLKNLRKALYTQCLRYLQAIIEFFPAEIKVSRPQGGFVLWLQLPENVDSYELYQAAIREKISFAPGHIFSTSPVLRPPTR